jgi:undecaprenyl-diphosphatase
VYEKSIPCFIPEEGVENESDKGYNRNMTYVEAIVLGIVQGLTEFLPVSSTGHLILARTVFGLNDAQGLAIDAVLQLATVAAVFVYFFPDIWLLTQTALRKLGRLPVNKKEETLLYALIIGTIPAVFFGLLLESFMESTFRSPLLVAFVLVAGSILFMYAEYVYQNKPRTNEITIASGIKIGLFQVLALIPGMSRSGATIAGGMLLGLSRSEAARFAFLLAIPVIAGAGVKKLLELIVSDTAISWGPVIIGSAVAFVTGLLAIHLLLAFVRSHTLWPFIWYRLILAGFVVFVFFFG